MCEDQNLASSFRENKSDIQRPQKSSQYIWSAALVHSSEDRLDQAKGVPDLEGVVRKERHNQERFQIPVVHNRIDRMGYEKLEENEVLQEQRLGNYWGLGGHCSLQMSVGLPHLMPLYYQGG